MRTSKKFPLNKKLIKFQGEIIIFLAISEGVPKLFWHTLFAFDLIATQEHKIFPKPLLEVLEQLLAYLKIIILTPVYQKFSSSEAKFDKLWGVPKLY